MAKKKEQISFLQRAIEGLTQDGFDEAVRIFQKYYLKNEIVDVNGTNDGGCDIKIYENKRELKKCVQVTIRKDWENKLKKELSNVNDLIAKHQYSDKYDFFCSSVISEMKIEEYKQYALNEYSIDLTIYEAHRLSQLQCPELRNYLYSLHNDIIIRPDQLNIDKVTRSIYDFLTAGKGSSDIKNDILNSFIISILYEKGSMAISSLKNELEERLNKKIPDITHTINLLKTTQRIIKDQNDLNKIKLSDTEYDCAKNIFDYASLVEQEFKNSFQTIISKYNVSNGDDLLEQLKLLYRNYYKNDIDEDLNNSYQRKGVDVFKSFDTYLNSIIQEAELRNSFVGEIKKLCDENTYLNRISASESFLSLYKSDKLEQYVTQSGKDIFIDTPVIIYLLCATFEVDNSLDWNDPLYRSVKSLYNLHLNNSEKVSFNVMSSYIGEVAGEFKKAFQIAQLEDTSFFSYLGSTRNTFYNYYRHLKDNSVFDEEEQITCFSDFLAAFDIDDNAFDSGDDLVVIKRLSDIIEDLEIEIISCPFFDDFKNAKVEYEKQLYDKQKSESAKNHDISQILYLLNNETVGNRAFITWDMSLPKLSERLQILNPQYKYCPIYNPAKLSNKIALECFNIDSSAITNDIFIYADKTFDISNKVKSLLEIISPIFGNKNAKNSKVLRSLGKMRKQQEDSLDYNEVEISNQNLPIEEVLIKILGKINDLEIEKQDKTIRKKFEIFILDQNNETFIIEEMKRESEAFIKNKEVKLDNLFESIFKIEI